jgi:hypothetical protein
VRPTSDPIFKSWEDFYAEAFAVADALWRSHKYLIAGEIAIATDGTTSGEILPKLRQTLERPIPRTRQSLSSALLPRCTTDKRDWPDDEAQRETAFDLGFRVPQAEGAG